MDVPETTPIEDDRDRYYWADQGITLGFGVHNTPSSEANHATEALSDEGDVEAEVSQDSPDMWGLLKEVVSTVFVAVVGLWAFYEGALWAAVVVVSSYVLTRNR